jgi:meso-butanediol dehydrogenase/(S,S)-butanediol dehydrogenase/diacetyl reductase
MSIPTESPRGAVPVADRLQDVTCLVTGAGRGIGRGIAHRLAAEGARVVVADLDEASAQAAAGAIAGEGGEALGVRVDVADRASTRAAIEATVERYGRLDVLFNNAGISQTKRFLDIQEDEWDRIMRVNGLGVLVGIQEGAQQMIRQGGGGKIVNTASIAGKQGYPLFAHYCASKFAVVALTQAAARSLSEHRITVNAFGPGVVGTELWQQLDAEFLELGETERQGQALEEFGAGILLGRVSQPEDIGGLAAFLASRDSDYITGQTIMVDGGMVLL